MKRLMNAFALGLALTTSFAMAQPVAPGVAAPASMAAEPKPDATWRTVPTQTIAAGGVDFRYRELGQHHGGTPVVLLTNLAAVLDNWDPRVVDGIAARHHVIAFSNRGIGGGRVGHQRIRSSRWPMTPSPSSRAWA